MLQTILNNISNSFWGSCSQNVLVCGVISFIFLVATSFLIFIVGRFIVVTLIKLVKFIIRYISTYGEGDLEMLTYKSLGNTSFIKLVIYKHVVQKIINKIRQPYYPSVPSFLVVLIVCSLFYTTAWFFNIYSDIDIKHNHYQNFIAIHAGIGAIILAFLILVAESSEFGKNHNKARLILKETWLFPLATMEILSLMLFAFGEKVLGVVAGILIVGLVTIRAVYKVTKLLINRYTFQAKERELVNERISASLDKAVWDRLKTNTLLSFMEDSKFSIEYDYFRPSRDVVKGFAVAKSGILKNVNIARLDKLLQTIDKLANTYNTSIRKNVSKDKKAGKVSSSVKEIIEEDYKNAKVSIYYLLGQQINEERKEIFGVPKKLYEDKEIRAKIEKEINHIFVITPTDSSDKEIRLEFDEIKDRAFEAINSSKVGLLNSVMETYEGIIEKFITVFVKYGGVYTYEAAKQERSSIFGGWSYIRWIRQDLYDVLSETIKSEKDKLITEIAYVPAKIVHSAYEKKDHLMFQEFIGYHAFLYKSSESVKDKGIRKYLIDRSSRYLIEFVDYRVSPDLDNPEITEDEVGQIKYFVLEIIMTYKFLLKYSFDTRDVEAFKKFIASLNNILHRFRPTEEHRKLELEWQMKASNISEEEKQDIEKRLKVVSALEEMEKDVNSKKVELLMGMAAWCLDKLKTGEFKDEKLLEMWSQLLTHQPTDIKKLITVYENTYSHRGQSFWGFDNWELEERRGDNVGEVVMTEITFDSKVHTLFVVLLLKALKGKTEEQVNISDVRVNRDLVYYFEKDEGVIKTILNEIAANAQVWEKVLTPEEIAAQNVVTKILDNLVAIQKNEQTDKLVATGISGKKITEFMDEFVEEYEKTAGLRKLLTLFKAIKITNDFSNKKNYWGFNDIQDKEAFIDDPYVDYSSFGEHYGRGLADSEDQIIFADIISNATPLGENPSLSNSVKLATKAVEDNGFKPNVIFTTFHLGEWRKAIFNNSEFIPYYDVKDNAYKGIADFVGMYKYKRREIPIFRVWNKGTDAPEIVVSDLKSFIKLIQYSPFASENEKKEMSQIGHFAYKITDLSSDENINTRQDLLSKNPVWLQKQSDKEKYLKQKVIIHVKEKFKVEIKNKAAAAKVKFKVGEGE